LSIVTGSASNIYFDVTPLGLEMMMSIEGIILHAHEAHGVSLRGTQVDFLLTAEHAKGSSVFEFSVAPGFDTGTHYHTKIEEIFYVLEGELSLRSGDRVVQGGPGTFVFVPMGAVHAFELSRGCGAHGSVTFLADRAR
jgi:quercetin dioxygenase-like cupin family protein